MNYRTHMMFGVTAATAAMAVAHQPLMPICLGIAAVAATLPDIDHPGSKASNANAGMVVIGVVIRLILGLTAFAFNLLRGVLGIFGARIPEATGDHRGPFTHSLLGTGIFALLFLPIGIFASWWWFAAAVIGVLSHVLADSLNPSGTPMFWPLTRKKFRFLPASVSVVTNTDSGPSLGENMAMTLCVLAFMGFLVLTIQGTSPSVTFRDAGRIWPMANSLSVDIAKDAAAANDAYVGLASLPAGMVKMPDGTLYFTDGTEVTPEELDRRGVKDFDRTLLEGGKGLWRDVKDGLSPITDIFGKAVEDAPGVTP